MKEKGFENAQQKKFKVIEGGKAAPVSNRRVAWTGWRDVAGKRNLLLEALARAANEKGEQLASLAESLGVTYGYIAQLRSGHRRTEHISDRFAESCARYLSVPVITVKLLSGRVQAEDFVMPAELEAKRLERGLRLLADDPLMGGLVPATLWDEPDDVKRLVLMLYQEVSGCGLLGYARTPEAIEAAIRGVSLLAGAQSTESEAGTPGNSVRDRKE